MSNFFILLIKYYQKWVSPIFGPKCRFTPSCSDYIIESLKTYGFVKGSVKGLWRILRCHPFSKGGYDPVLKTEKSNG